MRNLATFFIRNSHRFRMVIIKFATLQIQLGFPAVSEIGLRGPVPEDVLARRILSISNYIQIRKVIGFELVRIGGSGDGGYVMLDNLKNIEGALSLGIGPDASWDLDMSQRAPLIHMYDHSISKLPVGVANGTWFKEKVVSRNDSTGTSFEKTVKRLPESNNLILKSDIEDSEWEIFSQCSTEILSKFDQILIEFHWLTEKIFNEKYKLMVETFKNLSRTHTVINIHANNYAGYEIIANCPVPSVIEISYVRTKSYNFKEESFNENLNARNYLGSPEIFLKFPITS